MRPFRRMVSDGTRTRDRLDHNQALGSRPFTWFSALHRSICGVRAGRATRRACADPGRYRAIPSGFGPNPRAWVQSHEEPATGAVTPSDRLHLDEDRRPRPAQRSGIRREQTSPPRRARSWNGRPRAVRRNYAGARPFRAALGRRSGGAARAASTANVVHRPACSWATTSRPDRSSRLQDRRSRSSARYSRRRRAPGEPPSRRVHLRRRGRSMTMLRRPAGTEYERHLVAEALKPRCVRRVGPRLSAYDATGLGWQSNCSSPCALGRGTSTRRKLDPADL
jgi:hypothetical protein